MMEPTYFIFLNPTIYRRNKNTYHIINVSILAKENTLFHSCTENDYRTSVINGLTDFKF